ncbi:MAG: SDR family oxidoreductase [Planctomycetota bacterium]
MAEPDPPPRERRKPRPRHAIVTGGASGIGRELCRQLAALGWRVAVADRDGEAAQRVAEELKADGNDAVAIGLDVANAEAWWLAVAKLRDRWTTLDLLINNAGVLQAGPLIQSKAEQLEEVVSTNLLGAVLGCQACGRWLELTAMRFAPPPGSPRSGVINVASVFGPLAPPGFAAYSASKAGLVALSESLRGELAPHGLNVTAALPGVVPTGIYDAASFATRGSREACQRRVDSSQLTADQTARAILQAAHAGKATAVIGGRARRFAAFKRLLPGLARRAIARRAIAEMGLSSG